MAVDNDPIVSYGTGTWDDYAIREPGNAVYDSVTGQWMYVYTGQKTAGDMVIGALLSDDGETWTAHPGTPITGTSLAEDPYLAKNTDGTLYRDGSGRALMFCEEKPTSATHRGIEMWRSGANVLTGWTRFGRVLDRGAAATWCDEDVTSPVVIFDGTKLVMLFEGRADPDDGQIGYATSTDGGETFTAAASPIITYGSTWNANAIVCDDVILVGSTWVLVGHGQRSTSAPFNLGRYSTTDSPASWTASSFTEMAGNPFAPSSTNTVMCHGNDPTRVMWLHYAEGVAFGAVHHGTVTPA